MKPAFSYYGGKQRQIPNLLPLIPKHTVYVEPFAGGAALLFAKPSPDVGDNNHYREVLNDLDKRIVNFYRVCQDAEKRGQLLERLAFTPYARGEHRHAWKGEHETDVDRAWSWFVDVQMGFANKAGSGWSTSVSGRNHSASFRNHIARLAPILERLECVHIECDDAVFVIERWDSPQTLFYCDPPYPGADQGYTHQYSHDDFAGLVEALDNCQGSFMLSAYDVGLCPDHWERHDFSATMTAQNGRDADVDRKRTETVWRMDRSANVRPEIKDMFDSGKFDCFGGPTEDSVFSLPLFQPMV